MGCHGKGFGMEKTRSEISEQQVRLFQTLTQEWQDAATLAKSANIAERSGRKFAGEFVTFGIAEVFKVFPAYRYRLKKNPDANAKTYAEKLKQAASVFA